MKTAALFAVVALAGSALAGTNLLVNGSFEESNGLNPGGGWTPLPGGSTAITGWVTTGGGVDYMGTIWASAHGIRNIDLNNTSPGGIAQTFTTVAGHDYLVRFAMAANFAGAPTIKTMTVHAAGQSANFEFDYIAAGSTQANPGWVYHEWTFTAIATATTLHFQSTNTGVYGPALDDVAVYGIVPTPGSLALLGLGGLTALRRRR